MNFQEWIKFSCKLPLTFSFESGLGSASRAPKIILGQMYSKLIVESKVLWKFQCFCCRFSLLTGLFGYFRATWYSDVTLFFQVKFFDAFWDHQICILTFFPLKITIGFLCFRYYFYFSVPCITLYWKLLENILKTGGQRYNEQFEELPLSTLVAML